MQRDLTRAGLAIVLLLGALASLTRVFADLSWLPVTLGAAVLSVVLASAARLVGFRIIGSLAASLIGLAAFVYTQHLGPGPLLPGMEQLREAIDLFQLGMQQFRDEPAPTVPLDGLLLITSTGAWAVGWATHELLVRTRSVGLPILPSGVLWAVPLTVPLPEGRTWPHALPFAAACALTMLAEGDRDVLSDADAGGFRRRRQALGMGATLGAVALLTAALAPAVLPGYGGTAWVDLERGPDPRGYQPIVDIGDRLLLPEAADIMTVQADRRTYLRLAALDSFDGTTWKLGPPGQSTFQPSPDTLFPADGTLPRETAIAEGESVEVLVEVLDLENIYVPVPYQPVRLEGDGVGDMVYSLEGGFVASGNLEDNEIGGRAANGVQAGTRYRVESVLPTATYEELAAIEYPPAAVRRWTQLPGDGYPQLGQVANEVYAAAGALTAIDRAFALQEWFTGPDSTFEYSLEVDALRGDAALLDFVLGTRTGYCEYFATAMAVMLRETGIPARVSVGFLAGQLTLPADPAVGRTLNTYTVSTRDAHAWVEVLFPGRGWIRFEPTPRSDGATMPPRPDELDPLETERERRIAEAAAAAAEEETTLPEDDPNELPGNLELNEFGDENFGVNSGGGVVSGGRRWVLGVFALIGIALLAAVAHWRGRAHHPGATASDRVRYAQRRLHHHALGWGVGRGDAETPRDVAARWIAEGRVEPSAAQRFTHLVERAAFGSGVAETEAAEAEDLAERLLGDLRVSVTPRDRLLAPLREPVDVARELAGRISRLGAPPSDD